MSTYGDLSVHRWMLRDAARNEAFRQALAHLVKPGDVVLDMGAGTGILSIFAVAAGAKKVYAVERTDSAAVARRMVVQNGHAGTIEVIQQDLEDVTLHEKVDVLVSEWMGGFGVDENMLAPLVIARDRWLKPGGKIVPGRVTAVLAPAEIPDFDEAIAHWRSRPHGVDMSVIASMSTQESFHTQVHLTPEALLATPQDMWSHDPYTVTLAEADGSFRSTLTFHAARAGTLSGFAAWFTAEMGDGGILTNAVGAPDTHWGRTLFPLDHAIAVSEGTPLRIEVICDPSAPGTSEFTWTVTVGDRKPELHDTRRARQEHLRDE